ncbi:MAG: hypothetical protein JWP11_2003 [Frankiales bacterium]|nr:hypothetical protein [Frankiales bacterium]
MSVRVRPTLALGLSAVFLFAGVASAADAPKTTAKSATFFLRQEGCGTTAEAGRLEPKDGGDGATGCGTVGGLPLAEAEAQAGADGSETYASVGKGLPIKLDASKKVTGQLAAESWIGFGAGAGSVTFDVTLVGVDTKGKSIDFGSTTVTGSITPGQNVVLVPFTLAIPGGATTPVKSLALNVFQHGANLGFSAKHLSGDAYVVFPTKK